MVENYYPYNGSIESLIQSATLLTAVGGKKGADSDVYQSGKYALHMYLPHSGVGNLR